MRSYEETVERAAELVRMVIPRLAKAKLPINPINYALWYEYFLGRNRALMNELDNVMARPDGLSPEHAEELFHIHILGASSGRLQHIGKQVHHILESTSGQLTGTSENLEQFNREVSQAKSLLDEAVDPNEIRPVVKELLSASESVICANKSLSQQLALRSEEIERLKEEINTIRSQASLDPLTGVANRRTFDKTLSNALTENSDNSSFTCLLLVDIDHFKGINDNFGHLVGDRVIRYIANVLTDSVKGRDTVARYGGEEFAVILPNTKPEGAQAVAENIRRAIESARLRRSKDGELLGKITVSIGVAWAHPGQAPNDLTELADQALYQAKRNGRNQVAIGGLCDMPAQAAAS